MTILNGSRISEAQHLLGALYEMRWELTLKDNERQE